MKGIVILGQFVEVRTEPITANNAGEMEPLSTGEFRIRLDSATTERRKQVDLIHEIIEVIDTMVELKLDHHKIQALAWHLFNAGVRPPELVEEPQ